MIWTNIRWEHRATLHLFSALWLLCKLREILSANLCEKVCYQRLGTDFISTLHAESLNSMLGNTLEVCRFLRTEALLQEFTCTKHQGPNPSVKPLWAALYIPPQLQECRDLWKDEQHSKNSSDTEWKQEVYIKKKIIRHINPYIVYFYI